MSIKLFAVGIIGIDLNGDALGSVWVINDA